MTSPIFQARPHRPRQGAYTLVEVLIVIGIIVLVIALGMPLFGVFTGARSIESAQNQLGALINSARNEAVAMQRVTGILFYRDPASADRVSVLSVYASDPQPNDLNTVDVYLDTFADREPVVLPVGITAQVVNNADNSTTNGVRTGDGYLGYNSLASNTPPVGGVILFDGRGQLAFLRYAFRMGIPSGNATVPSALSRVFYGGTVASAPADILLPANGNRITSQVGFVLFNTEQFNNAGGDDPDPFLQSGGGYTAVESNEEKWIDNNSTPFIVNRYNGTLIKGE